MFESGGGYTKRNPGLITGGLDECRTREFGGESGRPPFPQKNLGLLALFIYLGLLMLQETKDRPTANLL